MPPLVSICIPSFNRPQQLNDLLNSLDCDCTKVEVIICEDSAPKRIEVRETVEEFCEKSKYKIEYNENDKNLGFDGNLRNLVQLATGEFIIFMGDDDLFVPGKLDIFLKFLEENDNFKYILRSYLTIHKNGMTELFQYLPEVKMLPAGPETVAWLFKRSVNLSGFTISRSEALKFATDKLDGTLLYQVYLMSQVCIRHPSIYCDIAFSHAVQSFRDNKPMFGSSNAEKGKFTPGSVTESNSINFIKSYFEVTEYLDAQHGSSITPLVLRSLSKNSYPILSIQRKNGPVKFIKYAKILQTELNFGITANFHIFKWALFFGGEFLCDRIIISIKKRLGYTPNL
jgi:abequosyltransferase